MGFVCLHTLSSSLSTIAPIIIAIRFFSSALSTACNGVGGQHGEGAIHGKDVRAGAPDKRCHQGRYGPVPWKTKCTK